MQFKLEKTQRVPNFIMFGYASLFEKLLLKNSTSVIEQTILVVEFLHIDLIY